MKPGRLDAHGGFGQRASSLEGLVSKWMSLMRIDSHVAKVERLDIVRQRLDPTEDFELWFWASLTGGMNALNASLHAVGATNDGPYFSTQVVDIYLQADPVSGTWTPTIRFDGDIMHVGLQTIEKPLPQVLEQACKALEVLEAVRDPCVRGDREITKGVIDACETAYRDCLRLTMPVVRSAGRPMI
jgi:hypothetical protein